MIDFIEINREGKTDISLIKNHRLKITQLRLDGEGIISNCTIGFGKNNELIKDEDKMRFILSLGIHKILYPINGSEIYLFDFCFVEIPAKIIDMNKITMFFKPPIEI